MQELGLSQTTERKRTGEELAVSRVHKTYSRRKVVNDVSLSVYKGEIVGLLGPNGAGKTTTFYMVVGLITPDEGRILLNGTDITHDPMYKRARQAIGYLAQEPSIFRKLTVEENILAILEFTGMSKKDQHEKLERLLEDLNITRIRKSHGYALSGGERRRVEIARALTTDPSFILLDEPFAGVDPIAVFDIQEIVHKLKARGLGVLITDHSVLETLKIVDYAYIMNEGKLFIEGPPSVIASDETAQKVYLGKDFEKLFKQVHAAHTGAIGIAGEAASEEDEAEAAAVFGGSIEAPPNEPREEEQAEKDGGPKTQDGSEAAGPPAGSSVPPAPEAGAARPDAEPDTMADNDKPEGGGTTVAPAEEEKKKD